MNTPKISVIVPVYKVEPYLRKCLDSIINQTYQNLEIILVDDGSPDNCGLICDTYAAQDRRVKVIHKTNGGISSARNAGLAAATGDWVGWVDSDDWIEEELFACVLEQAARHGADVIAFGHVEECRNRTYIRSWDQALLLNAEEALELLLKNEMPCAMWDKLWRRPLFEGIPFPEGKNYEDMAVTHRLLLRAKKVVCLPIAMYHYVQRTDSILGDSTLANRMNHYLTAMQRLEELKGQWPQFLHLLEGQCVASAVTIWCGYYINTRAERRKYRPQLEEISAFARQHYRQALEHLRLGRLGRAVIWLVPYARWWSFALAGVLGWVYALKQGRRL